ncbi:MAG: prepilin peptidase [Aestuariivirga sp.]
MRPTLDYGIGFREFLACAAAGGLIAAATFYLADAAAALAAFYLAMAMLLIMLIDARSFIIPDWLSLPAIPAGVLATFAVYPAPWDELLTDRILAAAAASGFLFAVRHIHWRTRGMEGLGLGDVKLAAVAGTWLGLANLAPTCLLATVAALAAVLIHHLKTGGSVNRTTRVPFGSFIAPAILGVWLWHVLQPWTVNLVSSGGG